MVCKRPASSEIVQGRLDVDRAVQGRLDVNRAVQDRWRAVRGAWNQRGRRQNRGSDGMDVASSGWTWRPWDRRGVAWIDVASPRWTWRAQESRGIVRGSAWSSGVSGRRGALAGVVERW